MPNSGADSEPVELKAGHPPAVKVGNMRVTQRTHSTSSDKNDAAGASASDSAEQSTAERKSSTSGGDSASVPSACSFAPKTVVDKGAGGVSESLTQHNSAEAIKHIHEKPHATHENRGPPSNANMHIHQPRK